MEDRALRHQIGAQRMGVGEVTVMGDGEAAAGQVGEQGLDVAGAAAASGGIAVMSDGEAAFQVPGGLRIAAEGIAHELSQAWHSAMARCAPHTVDAGCTCGVWGRLDR